MKDEALSVQEWIDHYVWQGADHLFIIDNGSTDTTVAQIEASEHRNRITLLHRPQRNKQVWHYRSVVRAQRIAERFRLLMVADGDEFWFARRDQTLVDAIRRFEAKFDVIYARWANFGCEPTAPHPASLRRELVYRAPDLAWHTAKKWIVKTDVLSRESIWIHKISGACSSRTTVDHDYLQLNHYVTQSYYFWTEVKMKRGFSSTAANKERTLEQFSHTNEQATYKDEALAERIGAGR